MFRSVAASLALALLLTASPASAQRIVTYGDSLSDNGNLPAGLAPPPPYNGGRFTNGITWTEIISGGSQGKPLSTFTTTGNVNLALGGSRTDTTAGNLNGPIPSMTDQIATFRALGGTYGSRDLVTLQGGANNIFQYFGSNGFGAGITQAGIVANATGAANDLAGNAATLVSQGARRILVSNLPDIGTSPQFAGGPAASGTSLASSTFNSALSGQLTALAAANPGVNFIKMDWAALFTVVTRNAAAFGYVNTTQACINVASCVTGSNAVRNTYLFWDGVHPTATGHQILARYASILLAPEETAARIAPVGDVAVKARQSASDDAFDRAAGWARGQFAGQNGAYAIVTGSAADVNARSGSPGYRYQLGGSRVGIDRATSNTLIGVSAGASVGSIGGGALSSKFDVYDLDLYGAWLNGPLYVSGQGGFSYANFDNARFTGLGPVTAGSTTRAWQGNLAAEAGVMANIGGVTIVPSGRLNYVASSLSEADESGDILTMSYERRTIGAFFGGARLRAITTLSGIGGTAFAEVGYERLLSGSGNTINARFIDNTAFPFSSSVANPLGRGFNAKIGIDSKIGEGSSIALQYGVSLQDGNGVAHNGLAQIKVPF